MPSLSVKLSCAAATWLLAFAPMAGRADPLGTSSTFQPEDIFGLSVASDPQVRPDGRMVAYVRTTNDIMVDRGRRSIWFVDLSTGRQAALGGLGSDTDMSQPRWSPDGARLAFFAKPADGQAGVYIYSKASGRIASITSLPRNPDHLTWSPDGRTLAFIMRTPEEAETLGRPLHKPEGAKWAEPLRVTTRIEYRFDGEGERKPGYTHIFLVSAVGGAPQALTSGKFDDTGPLSWSPDSRSIVFTGRRDPHWEQNWQLSALYRVSLQGGEPTRLTPQEGPYGSAAVSPDGRQIAFSGFVDRYRGYENRLIYVMDADGSGVRTLSSPPDRSVDRPQWAADGRSVYAYCEDRGIGEVVRLGLGGGVETVASGLGGSALDLPYTGGDGGSSRSFSVTREGAVVFTQSGPDHPRDLAVVQGGHETRLTHLNEGLLGRKKLGAVQALPVTSSFDGAPVGAWIVTPPDFDPSKRYPLILEIHGGPFASYGPIFSTDDQLYAAAGYVVLFSNPRGSTSYGDAFANGITDSYPGTDYVDLMSAVDAAVAKGFVDPNRMFVTGLSGGGALTAWIVGKTHRFRAAAVQSPVIDWTSETLTSDRYPWMSTHWFHKEPWKDHETYWKLSPISLVGNVTTPTMLVVGDRDVRTPPSQAEEMYSALQIRGVPTALVKVPGAFHDTAALPSHAAAKSEAIIAWFARYDAKAAAP